jgi:hypothetical protein
LKDTLTAERSLVLNKLSKVLDDPVHGAAIRRDLHEGFNLLPAWMQSLVRELPGCAPQATRQSPGAEKPPSVRRRTVKQVDAH